MSVASGATIVSAAERQRESWANAGRGNASWFTLLSSDVTQTTAVSAGVMEIPPNGGVLRPHRRRPAEIYFVHEGTGSLTVNGVATTISMGTAAFIPGDDKHSVRNDSTATLKIFTCFLQTALATWSTVSRIDRLSAPNRCCAELKYLASSRKYGGIGPAFRRGKRLPTRLTPRCAKAACRRCGRRTTDAASPARSQGRAARRLWS
jgi:mannose-6-phosphate isomerase-like protein (cupin superfamily)